MKRILEWRANPAMIVAVIALVAALGGTAVAGGFLTTKKFKKQALRGPVQYVSVRVTVPPATPPASESVQSGSANCPAGSSVIGGGVKIVTGAFTAPIDSYPTPTGWAGTVFQGTNPNPGTFIVTAICATVQQTSGTPATS